MNGMSKRIQGQRWGGVLVLLLLLGGLWAGRAGAQAGQTAVPTGTIAYVRATTGDEVRLIEAGGGGDRRLWAYGAADPQKILDVMSLDWRPDGGELAFSSNHERTCSIFASDLYGIRPDGGGFRRIGNGPSCQGLAALPKGQVTVTVRNNTSKFDTNFYVTVQGAPGVVHVVVPWNGTATVTLPDVADFGAHPQWVALLHRGDAGDQASDYRWIIGEVDVRAGQTVTAVPNPAVASGDGAPQLGAWGPTWRSSGGRVGYALSAAACLSAYAVDAGADQTGLIGEPILTADAIAPCSAVWGPTAATAGQVLFAAFPNLGLDGATFYRANEGAAASSGQKLLALGPTNLLLWYDWLPDGSGFLFARATNFVNPRYRESNLFEVNFASGKTKQITTFDNEHVRSFDVSPDGRFIVFERAPSLERAAADLWIMNRDGSEMRLLVRDGRAPAWGKSAALPQPLTPRARVPLVIKS